MENKKSQIDPKSQFSSNVLRASSAPLGSFWII